MTYTPQNPNPLSNPTKDPAAFQVLPVLTPASIAAAAPTLVDPVDPGTMGIVNGINDVLMVALPILFPGIGVAGVAVDAAVMKLAPYLVAVLQNKQFTLAELRGMTTDLNSFGASFPTQPGYVNAFSGGATPAPGTGSAPASPGSAVPVSMTVKIGGSVITVTASTFESLLASLVSLGSAVATSPTTPILTPVVAPAAA